MKFICLFIVSMFLFSCFNEAYYKRDDVISSGYTAFVKDQSFQSDKVYKYLPGRYFLEIEDKGAVYNLEGLENIEIDGSDISIVGNNKSSLFYVKNCKNITIKNFLKIEGFQSIVSFDSCSNVKVLNNAFVSRDSSLMSPAIDINISNKVEIINNNIFGFEEGVLSKRSQDININANGFNEQNLCDIKIDRCKDVDIFNNLFDNLEGSSIDISKSTPVNINYNIFSNSYYGVTYSGNDTESKVRLGYNTFRNIAKHGVQVDSLKDLTIIGSNFTDCGNGIVINYLTKLNLSNNSFDNCKGNFLSLDNFENADIVDNSFFYSNTAISFKGKNNSHVRVNNNKFEGNGRNISRLGGEKIDMFDNRFIIKHSERRFNNLSVKKFVSDEFIEKVLRLKSRSINSLSLNENNTVFTLIDTLTGEKSTLSPFRKRWNFSREIEIPELTESSASWLAQSLESKNTILMFDNNNKMHKSSSLMLRSKSDDPIFLEYIPRRSNFMEWRAKDINQIKFWTKIKKGKSKGLKNISVILKNSDGSYFETKFKTVDLNSSEGEWVLFKKVFTKNEKSKIPGIINGLEILVEPNSDDYVVWFDNLEFK